MIASAPQVVTLTIDDREIGASSNQTILEVCREQGVEIPTLCHLEGLTPIGACRMCLVEVVGQRRLLPACVTRVSEGMVVKTRSEKLDKYRRMTLELLFSEGNHVCAICVSNGHCELQKMAQNLGMDHLRVPYIYPKKTVDASHLRFGMDHNRCILCQRCVRACDEIEGAHTKDCMGRGIGCRIITDLNQPWGDSTSCTTCGKCVQVCPTGALFEKGRSTAEMKKRLNFLPYLQTMRGGRT